MYSCRCQNCLFITGLLHDSCVTQVVLSVVVVRLNNNLARSCVAWRHRMSCWKTLHCTVFSSLCTCKDSESCCWNWHVMFVFQYRSQDQNCNQLKYLQVISLFPKKPLPSCFVLLTEHEHRKSLRSSGTVVTQGGREEASSQPTQSKNGQSQQGTVSVLFCQLR